MQNTADILRRNLATVREQIQAACDRAGRREEDVRLVAVTKSARIETIRDLVSLSQVDLAENRPQQLLDRYAQVEGSITWHQIGTLQRNKIRKILPLAQWIHSLDSLKLLADVDRIAGELQLRPRVLLQVNVSGEESKQGFDPDVLWAQWDDMASFSHLDIQGLMTMAPYVDDAEGVRPVFRALRTYRDRLVELSEGRFALAELSMGMSGDFEVAVEEGATMVRIGSALFEGLD
ncbi:MAG: YggS family pyridoxal phosphate-dependent enzyme [Planctomycetota bacterium]|nr:YggS family pyridoxal phosphate-dependent enzyme [Planctomycetota bacterium]MDA1212255.1 YggS family pyridoxal phosphate-dependent enzyme [Planctomycetota bacterium]